MEPEISNSYRMVPLIQSDFRYFFVQAITVRNHRDSKIDFFSKEFIKNEYDRANLQISYHDDLFRQLVVVLLILISQINIPNNIIFFSSKIGIFRPFLIPRFWAIKLYVAIDICQTICLVTVIRNGDKFWKHGPHC